jgi:SH3-like domain-containing protein
MAPRAAQGTWRWIWTLGLAIGACAGSVAAAELPYYAYVTSDDVYVRSGPGRNYYPTDKLRKGQRVEVYRHDPGGWLAIRPPRSSFAWVAKRHLDLGSESLATVNTDRAVARVGSAFSDARDVIQVRLDKGEQVELVAAPDEDSPWCKIAPPAGEFRWVFSKYVDRGLPADLAADEREAAGARGDTESGDEGSDEEGVRLASSEFETADGADESSLGKAGTRSPPTLAAGSYVGRELGRMELELSTIVVGEISTWSFGELQKRAEALLKEAQTPVERGQARILLSKLERFEDIRRRHEALRQAPAAADPLAPAAGTLAQRRADVAQFDGVGRLSPVISEKVGGPQYALVDNSNAVISFVTPAPGVNLRPYVDHYVGVNGQRGYLSELARQHISVQRVTVLDTVQR